MKTPSMIPASRCKQPSLHMNDHQAEAFLSAYLPEEKGGSRYAVRDILRRNFDQYCASHPVPYYSQKVVHTLMKCGTGELGYSLNVCRQCGMIQMSADRCGSRYCSVCGYLRKMRWVYERQSELVEGIPYFHIVFTVPHELNSLVFQNQKLLLGNLFRSAGNAVLELSAERKKMIPGIIMILHTFGSAMTLHYHIHMLVSGGGLSLDKKSFRVPKSKSFFLPVGIIRARYRALFLNGLKELHDSVPAKLEYTGEAKKYRNSYEWKELLDTCYNQDWNVEIRKYFSPSSGTNAIGNFSSYANRNAISDEALRYIDDPAAQNDPSVGTAVGYLAEYSGRTAITDNRIRSADAREVSFEYKDYRTGGQKKIMTLSADEFIRRFLLHILPKGVQKIRYAGYLAGCVKQKNLKLIRKLLGQKPHENKLKGKTSLQVVNILFGIDFSICPRCTAKLHNEGHRMNRRKAAESIIAFQARAS